MKTRPALVAAYAAAAIACIAIVAVLFKTWGPLTPKRAPATVNMAQVLQTRLAGAGRDQAVELYQARGFSTVWFEGDQISSDGRRVVALLAAAETEALPAARYRLPAMPGTGARDEAKAEYDLALTIAALRYAADMRWGAWRPDRFFNDVSMTRERDDVALGMIHAADSGNAASYLQGLAPPEHDYGLLRAALARYRAAAASGGWPMVAAEKRLSGQNMTKLTARLQAEGYLQSGSASVTPSAIAAALKAYQNDSGITVDGHLNERTAQMLNVPAAARAQQIAANMERLRWMPHNLGDQYILVNVPDASLVLMESGQSALTSRVVVGAPDKQTPILAAKAMSVTINPAWHVPKSIVAKEIQPKIDQDSDYLESKHMEMENGEVVQLPGPDNALGSIKFELPNVFNVYLHDTPSKHAFLSDDRAQSHGCVRVEQIKPLTEHVLGMTDDELQQAIAGGKTESRRLSQPIPVYIQYFTAIARDDGRTVFREDIYGRDARMIGVMFSGQPATRLASGESGHTNR